MSYPLWTDGKAEVGRVSEEMTDYRPFEGVTHDFISRNWIASETEKKNSLCNLPRVHHVAVGLANVVAHTSTFELLGSTTFDSATLDYTTCSIPW